MIRVNFLIEFQMKQVCRVNPVVGLGVGEEREHGHAAQQSSSSSPFSLAAVIQPTAALSASNPEPGCQQLTEVEMESDRSSLKILTAY